LFGACQAEGRCDQIASAAGDLDRDLPVIANRPVPDHGVIAVRLDICETVVEIQLKIDTWMPLQEGIESGTEMEIAEADWH
jgi:hypothetical protein